MYTLIRRNPLAFPGRAPGFDSTHPAAAGMAPGHGFSAVPIGANFVDMLNGAPGSASGTSATIDGSLGPCVVTSNTSQQTQFSGRAAVADTVGTLAIIVRPKTLTVGNYVQSSTTANTGFGLGTNGTGAIRWSQGAGNNISTITLSAGVPYFLVGSYKGSSPANIVVTNLLNGTIQSGTLAIGLSPSTSNGTYRIGNTTQNQTLNVAATMFAQSALPMPALLQWAADPWAFWYPRTLLQTFDWLTTPGGPSLQALFASGGGIGAARAKSAGAASVIIRSSAAGQGAAAPSGRARILTSGAAAGRARASGAFTLALQARAASAARGPVALKARLALAVRGVATGAGRGAISAVTMLVALSGAALGKASGRAPIAASASIAARGIAAAFGRLQSLLSPKLAANSRILVRPGPRRFASTPVTRRFASTLRVPMPKGPDFSLMDVGETVTGAIDFSVWLQPGATITSIVSVTAVNYYPSAEGNSYLTLVGTPQIGTAAQSAGGSGTLNTAVLQQWAGIGAGTARITVTVETSDGQTLIGWAHQPVGQPN